MQLASADASYSSSWIALLHNALPGVTSDASHSQAGFLAGPWGECLTEATGWCKKERLCLSRMEATVREHTESNQGQAGQAGSPRANTQERLLTPLKRSSTSWSAAAIVTS